MINETAPPALVIALPSALDREFDQKKFTDWAVANGLSLGRDHSHMLSHGYVSTEAVSYWYGLPAPSDDMALVNLQAPDLVQSGLDENPPRWLEYRRGEWGGVDKSFCCWTSDLIAIRFD